MTLTHHDTKALIKKELFSFINSPLAYMLLVPFLLISQYLFFRTAFVVGDANLRPFIELLPWFLVVIAPALTMRSFADEYKRGTLELLFSHPLTEWRLITGKFIGLVLFYSIMLGSTFVIPAILIFYANPDIGVIISQYLGALLIGSSLLAIGLAVSAWIKNSVGSFLVAAAFSFTLLLAGSSFVLLGIPAPFNRIIAEVGLVTHLNNISRGVIDLRDILYFVSIVGVSLTAAVMKLSERKLAESKQEKRKLWVFMGLIILVTLLLNVVMSWYPLRLDTTANQRFSLSQGTKTMLRELPDRVTVKLYLTDNLPGPMQLTQKEVVDRLRDFSRYGNSRLQIETHVIGSDDPEAKSDALSQGVQEITFNQIASGSFQAQAGILGLVVAYADKTEAIPFIQDASNLEYQLARMILKLTREQKNSLALVDATGTSSLTSLTTYLQDQYEVVTVSQQDTEVKWDKMAAVIVVDDGSSSNATSSAMVKSYIQNNGNAIFFIDGVNVDEQFLTTSVSTSEYLKVVQELGITVRNDIVYDLQQAENITLPGGSNNQIQYIIPYPFWIRASLISENAPWAKAELGNALVAWASSIELGLGNEEIKPLLMTSLAAGRQEGNFTIRPDQIQDLEPSGKSETLGAIKISENSRLVVIADSHLLMDNYWTNAPVNQAFVGNMVDYVAKDAILSQIPQRVEGRIPFSFNSVTQVKIAQYIGMLAAPIIITIIGIYWLSRRKKRTHRQWIASTNS